MVHALEELTPTVEPLDVGQTITMPEAGRDKAPARLENIMWVRVGEFLVKPNQAANLRSTYNEQAVPKVRAYPGNLGCLLLEPAADGEPFVVMTIWKDRAAAESYESSGAAMEVVSLVRAFFAGPPTVRSYESASVMGLSSAG